MNPNAPAPSFELPVPQPDRKEEPVSLSQEQLPPQIERMPQAAPQPTPPAGHGVPGPQPLAPPQLPPQAAQAPLAAQAHSPATADDSDLIEKEWVEKAKQIVAATREDPHAQNRQMSRFKADYLKKRYNKDIKVEES
jgi:hypothetical protein